MSAEYSRYKYEEKKSITQESNDSKKTQSENNYSQNQDKKNNDINKINDKPPIEETQETCIICGEILDEHHKCNIISREEFEAEIDKIKDEATKFPEILNKNEEHRQTAEFIEKALQEKFMITEPLKACKEAHHIISKSDIFANVKKDDTGARLALTAGYNINNPDNGIFLPSCFIEQNIDWNNRDEKFKVMDATKMQIHKGNHAYFVPTPDKLTDEEKRKYPKENYSEILTEEYKKMVSKIVNKLRAEEKCFLEEKEKQFIINSFNKFSLAVKRDIDKFKNDPKSCKFYVSDISIIYAYEKK